MLKSIIVRDHYKNRLDFFDGTSGYAHSWLYTVHDRTPEGLEELGTSMRLLPKTARTNVMLKDESGKFVSFRDSSVPHEIRQAMIAMRPFPNPEDY